MAGQRKGREMIHRDKAMDCQRHCIRACKLPCLCFFAAATWTNRVTALGGKGKETMGARRVTERGWLEGGAKANIWKD